MIIMSRNTRAALLCALLSFGVAQSCGDTTTPTNNGASTTPGATNNNTTTGGTTGSNNTTGCVDSDGDGCCDDVELADGTSPDLADTDGDGLDDCDEKARGTNPNDPDTDGGGITDGSEVLVGTNPLDREDDTTSCGFDQQTASLEEKPVDIIFVIDNSGSMRAEIKSVERNINENFASIIRQSGLDYRVIMITRHGDSDDERVCIAAPLSGTDCSPVPRAPANTKSFKRYNWFISSSNSLLVIRDTFDEPEEGAPNGWGEWLRDGAFKVFIEITDDAPRELSAQQFEEILLNFRSPNTGDPVFGEPGRRNYQWHSIVGVVEKPRATDAYTSDEPIQNEKCDTAVDPADVYQRLSILTGGIRYPVCEFDNYDTVFRTVAQGIIEQSRIRCSFDLPATPEGSDVDPDTSIIEFRDSGAPIQRLPRVPNTAACNGDGFAITQGRVQLCEQTCARVTPSTEGTLSFLSGCRQETCEGSDREVCDDGIDNDCNGFIDARDPGCLF